MTEEEAKTKWCPFAKSFYWAGTETRGIPVSINRYTDEGWDEERGDYVKPTTPHADCLCLGSGCMAWCSAGGGTGRCGLTTQAAMSGFNPAPAGWNPPKDGRH